MIGKLFTKLIIGGLTETKFDLFLYGSILIVAVDIVNDFRKSSHYFGFVGHAFVSLISHQNSVCGRTLQTLD